MIRSKEYDWRSKSNDPMAHNCWDIILRRPSPPSPNPKATSPLLFHANIPCRWIKSHPPLVGFLILALLQLVGGSQMHPKLQVFFSLFLSLHGFGFPFVFFFAYKKQGSRSCRDIECKDIEEEKEREVPHRKEFPSPFLVIPSSNFFLPKFFLSPLICHFHHSILTCEALGKSFETL